MNVRCILRSYCFLQISTDCESYEGRRWRGVSSGWYTTDKQSRHPYVPGVLETVIKDLQSGRTVLRNVKLVSRLNALYCFRRWYNSVVYQVGFRVDPTTVELCFLTYFLVFRANLSHFLFTYCFLTVGTHCCRIANAITTKHVMSDYVDYSSRVWGGVKSMD